MNPLLIRRRRLLAVSLLPLAPWASHASGLADVLQRPAAAIRFSSKPAMARIVRAGDRMVAVGERGVILLSDDGGTRWRQARVPVSVSLTGVQFVDAQRGWAIGHAGVVLHSADGGESWILQLDGRAAIAAIRQRANSLSVQDSASQAMVRRAASLARQAEADGPDKPLLDLHFSDARQGWVVGAYGLALQTRDGGLNWQALGDLLPNPKDLHLYAVLRQGGAIFIAGEQGLFIRLAADGSDHDAELLVTPYRGSFFAMAALPQDALLLAGLRGTVLLRRPDGSIRTLDSGSTQAIVSVAALPQQRLALIDQSGRLLLGSAEAGTFVAQATQAERRWVAVSSGADGTLVGASTTGVARVSMHRSPAP